MLLLLLSLLQPSKVTATPVLSAEDMKKRELASALFGGRGGMNREGMLSVSYYYAAKFRFAYDLCHCSELSKHSNITFTSNRTFIGTFASVSREAVPLKYLLKIQLDRA